MLAPSWSPPAVLCVVLGIVLPCAASLADFSVRTVDARQFQNRLVVSAELDLALTEETEAAVNQGVPLVILTEFAVVEAGMLWDRRIVQHKARSRLRYHTLSGRYIVDNPRTQDMETFRSLREALDRIGTLRAIVLDWPDTTRTIKRRPEIVVRSRLDIDALPAPLRPMAYLSSSWQLGSDWTRWRVKQ